MTGIIKNEKLFRFLPAGSLKLIAIATMFIDHFFAGVFAPLYSSGYLKSIGILKYGVQIYDIGRVIGRFAFPVFCFLLVEGFFYTKSRVKYMCNLVIFALVSKFVLKLAMKRLVVHGG